MLKKLSAVFVVVMLIAVAMIPSSSHSLGFLVDPSFREWDTTGKSLLIGGKVVTCESGASCGCTSYTPKTTYQDSAGLLPNSNPIIIDSVGRTPGIWFTGTMKVTLCDRFNVVQKTWDNLTGVAAASDTTMNEWATTGLTPTAVNTTTFSVAGDHRTSFPNGVRIKGTIPAGTMYGTVTSSSYSSPNTQVVITLDDTAAPLTGVTAISTGIICRQAILFHIAR